MFLVNSRSSLVSATGSRSHRKGVHDIPVPLLPKLRGHFAEFLNHSLSRTPWYALPDHLCRFGVRAVCVLARGFSWQQRITEFASTGYASPLRISERRICLSLSLPACPSVTTDWYGYLPASPLRLTTTSEVPTQPQNSTPPKGSDRSGFGWLVPLIRHGRPHTGTGISTRCPSTTPVGLALGPDSPWADWPGPGTLGLSAGKVLTCLVATHACILTPPPSTTGHPVASLNEGRSPTHTHHKVDVPRLRRCA